MNSQVQMEDNDLQLQEEQEYRAGAYSLLAALFRAAPDKTMMDHLVTFSQLEKSGSELEATMSILGETAKTANIELVDDEYHALFVGLGRGQLLPYGSWYQTGFLMEKPLGILRNDLAALGYERCEETSEPEDHIAALCEVMSALITEGLEEATTSNCQEQQRVFFETHMKPWAIKFFTDLKAASSVDFYQPVADLGHAFFEFETQYFSMKV